MYQNSIHGKCECSLEPFQPWDLYHNSTRSNLVLAFHFQEDKKVYIVGPEFQVSTGWQLRCYNISKDELKGGRGETPTFSSDSGREAETRC